VHADTGFKDRKPLLDSLQPPFFQEMLHRKSRLHHSHGVVGTRLGDTRHTHVAIAHRFYPVESKTGDDAVKLAKTVVQVGDQLLRGKCRTYFGKTLEIGKQYGHLLEVPGLHKAVFHEFGGHGSRQDILQQVVGSLPLPPEQVFLFLQQAFSGELPGTQVVLKCGKHERRHLQAQAFQCSGQPQRQIRFRKQQNSSQHHHEGKNIGGNSVPVRKIQKQIGNQHIHGIQDDRAAIQQPQNGHGQQRQGQQVEREPRKPAPVGKCAGMNSDAVCVVEPNRKHKQDKRKVAEKQTGVYRIGPQGALRVPCPVQQQQYGQEKQAKARHDVRLFCIFQIQFPQEPLPVFCADLKKKCLIEKTSHRWVGVNDAGKAQNAAGWAQFLPLCILPCAQSRFLTYPPSLCFNLHHFACSYSFRSSSWHIRCFLASSRPTAPARLRIHPTSTFFTGETCKPT